MNWFDNDEDEDGEFKGEMENHCGLENMKHQGNQSNFNSVSLRERLSEKELQLLELRSTALQETSYLRSTLRKREMDLLEREAAVRQLKLKLQQDHGNLQAQKTKHDNTVSSLTDQVKRAVHQVNKFRSKVQIAEARRIKTNEVSV